MSELQKDEVMFGREQDIVYNKTIKAGKRIYYFDVKKNQKEELFITITESKKIMSADGGSFSFQKHKVFVYHEDFDKFSDALQEIMDYVKAPEVVQVVDVNSEAATAGIVY